MAKYQINISFRDEGNNTSDMTFNLDAANEAAADTRALALAGLLDDLSGAKVKSVSVVHLVDISAAGLKALPDAGADVERGQRLIFETPVAGVNPYVTIPGIRILYDFGAGEVRVVEADGTLNDSLTQWDDLFTELFSTGDYEDYRAADLTALLENYKVFKGRREGR